MAVHKSVQITNLDSVPAKFLKPNEWVGRVRIAYWTFETPAGGVAINDTIELVKLPDGARILHGRVMFDAMSTGAGVATASIGVSGTAAKYLEASSVDAAGSLDFANTLGRNQGDELVGATTIIATATVEAWAAAQTFNGYLLYVRD